MSRKRTKSNEAIINQRKIGQRISEEREKLGLSRAELAEIVELSDYYVGQLERGERQMSLPVLLRISACLHISLDYLVLGTQSYGKYPNAAENTQPYESERKLKEAEIQQLLDRCSVTELELLKKLIKTLLPNLRQNSMLD